MRENFGHASMATTSAYLHTEEDARHEATQEWHRIRWKRQRYRATLPQSLTPALADRDG